MLKYLVREPGVSDNRSSSTIVATTTSKLLQVTLVGTHPFHIRPDCRVISSLTRADSTLILQLRTGFCSDVGHIFHILRGDKGGKCRWCGGSEETVTHLFSKCRAVKNLRREFGVEGVKQLGSSDEADLRACVKFARRALAILA